MSFSVNPSLFVAFLDVYDHSLNNQVNDLIDIDLLHTELDKLKFIASDLIYLYTNKRGILKKDQNSNYCVIFLSTNIYDKFCISEKLKTQKIDSLYDILLRIIDNFLVKAELSFVVKLEKQRENICVFLNKN